MTNEAATIGLPTDMPQFFYRAFPQLTWLGPDPDRWKSSGIPSLDASNLPDHQLNYEYVAALQLPRDRYAFLALLISSGTQRRLGLRNTDPGFLPWRIAEMSEQLTVEWRLWRAAPAGSPERSFIERDIIRDSGILGHFVADASQPLHTTISYNGWIAPNPNGYANDCQIHSRFETEFVSHALSTEDLVPKLAAPQLRADYFDTAITFIRQSNALVEKTYQLDKAGDFSTFRYPISPAGKGFAADRLAAGASLLRDLWWSAWRNSEKPPKRREAVE
ncbi:MAG: hypothetical protein QOK37_1935 [Thermoanaerobaculia bacterium]|jgi:hypothetical protein|nr:hypothetical protein [Thermoanaerobaculia bacterium]